MQWDSEKYNLLIGLLLVEFIDQRCLAVTRIFNENDNMASIVQAGL